MKTSCPIRLCGAALLLLLLALQAGALTADIENDNDNNVPCVDTWGRASGLVYSEDDIKTIARCGGIWSGMVNLFADDEKWGLRMFSNGYADYYASTSHTRFTYANNITADRCTEGTTSTEFDSTLNFIGAPYRNKYGP